MGMNLDGKTAIVTGGGSGIGRGIALRLAQEGADMAIVDIDLASAQKVVEEIKARGRKGLAIEADVTSMAGANRMAKATLDGFGKIDILVNNAGGRGKLQSSPFYKTAEDTWDFEITLNMKTTLSCTRAVLDHMMERRYGKIINIASFVGMVGSSTGRVVYSAAKAGIIGFTKAMAKEVGSYGINVNSVSPGYIQTPGTKGKFAPKQLEEINKGIYLGRMGQPEDIASMVAFFASDDADYITGQNIAVCGGKSLG